MATPQDPPPGAPLVELTDDARYAVKVFEPGNVVVTRGMHRRRLRGAASREPARSEGCSAENGGVELPDRTQGGAQGGSDRD